MPSNHLTVSKNDGPPSTGAITCTWEDVVRLRLNSSAGVRSVRFEIFGYPPGWSAPAGWTFVSESRLYYSDEFEPADITLPTAASNKWGKWLTRLYVNEQLVDESTALEIVSPNGLHALPAGEGAQFGGAAQQWVKHLEEDLRIIEDGLGGGGGGGGGATIRQVFYDQGGTPADSRFASFSTAFTAATALLAEANGPVQIVMLNDNDPPEFPSGTFNAQGLIEIVGKTTVRGDRIEVDLQSGFVLQNARALRNLYIEHDIATAWLTASAATNLNLVLDNTQIVDNGAGADVCTLASGTTGNRLQLVNGSIYSGDSKAFTSTASGKNITVYLDSGILNAESFHGSAGAVDVYQGPDGSFDPQASYSGALTVISAVVNALAQAPTNVAFNNKRLSSVATPAAGTDVTNQNWVDGAQSVSVAGSGSVSLNAGNVAYGSLLLTGLLTGDRTVTLPSGQRGLWICNGTTGTYTLRIQGPSGGFCYLLPGQARRVYVDGSGILRGDALYLCETEIDVSLIGIGSGDTTTGICRLPGKFALERCERMTIVAPDGDGEYNDSVGFVGTTYDDVLKNNPYPFADTWGLAPAEWNTGFADGYSYSASARTLTYLVNGFNQSVANTVGKVRIRIAGRYFGT